MYLYGVGIRDRTNIQRALTESNKCIWLSYGVYLCTVRYRELFRELVEVRERQLPRIRLVGNDKVDHVVGDEVADTQESSGNLCALKADQDTYWSVY